MLFVLAARRVVVDAGALIKNKNKKNTALVEKIEEVGGNKKKREKHTPRRSEVTGCDRAVKTQSRNQLSEAAEHRGVLREPNS